MDTVKLGWEWTGSGSDGYHRRCDVLAREKAGAASSNRLSDHVPDIHYAFTAIEG